MLKYQRISQNLIQSILSTGRSWCADAHNHCCAQYRVEYYILYEKIKKREQLKGEFWILKIEVNGFNNIWNDDVDNIWLTLCSKYNIFLSTAICINIWNFWLLTNLFIIFGASLLSCFFSIFSIFDAIKNIINIKDNTNGINKYSQWFLSHFVHDWLFIDSLNPSLHRPHNGDK